MCHSCAPHHINLENFAFSALFWPEFQLSRRKFSKCSFPRPLIFLKENLLPRPYILKIVWPNKLISKNFTIMKNRLIKKNKNIYIKKTKEKKKFYRIFLTAILPTKSCKNNSKALFLHCIGLYLIFTI